MSKTQPSAPDPRPDQSFWFFSALIITIMAIVIGSTAYFAYKGEQHISELKAKSYEHPDAPVNDPAPAAIIQMITAEPTVSNVVTGDTGDTNSPAVSIPPFDMNECEKWSQEQRFKCEANPTMPRECCIGC